MAVTGIFLLPTAGAAATAPVASANLAASSPLHRLTARLVNAHNPTSLGPWRLQHRLYRSVPTSPADKSPPRHQDLLHLDHHPATAFVHVAEPQAVAKDASGQGEKHTTIAIPAQQLPEFAFLMKDQFGGMWQPRTVAHVVGGKGYSVGEFVVRMGELRDHKTGQGQEVVRGMIVCVQMLGATEAWDEGTRQTLTADGETNTGLEDLEASKALVRGLWEEFGEKGAREFWTASPAGGQQEELWREVQLWCEALRT